MASVTPQSVLLGLPPLKWRSLLAPPYDAAPVSVSHSQAERTFPYIDGAAHDNTGRDPIPLLVKLYFLNTLEAGSFPDNFQRWRDALLDGSPGDLEHPVMGKLRARVKTFDIVADANATLAGVIVNVTWTDTLEDPASQIAFDPLQVSAISVAQQADSALEAIGIAFPDGSGDSLADLFQQIDGLIFSASLSINGLINQAKGLIDTLIGLVDLHLEVTRDPLGFAARDLLTTLYGATLDIADRLGGAASRRTATIAFPFNTTLSRAATELGNTVEELMGLNLALLRSPSVPPQTPITYYAE